MAKACRSLGSLAAANLHWLTVGIAWMARMRVRLPLSTWLTRRLLAMTPLAAMLPGAHAGLMNVKISGLASLGPDVVLALDFVDGDGASNTLSTSAIASDGSTSLLGLTGSAGGSPSTSISFDDGSFFSEALVLLRGAETVAFAFDASTVGPAAGGFADAFSVFLLDPATLLPLLETSDLTGANALFRLEIDGSPGGAILAFNPARAMDVSWTVTPAGGTVPAPTPLLLVAPPLLWVLRRTLPPAALVRTGVALLLLLLLAASLPARADDLTASVQLTRGGLVLNRTSNTFDASVTVTNTSTVPLLGPLKLGLASATPANVALYNSHGRLPSGADYIVLPLVDGTLAPGASVTSVVRLITGGQAVAATQFLLEGQRLLPGQTALVDIQGLYPAGFAGPQAVPVGAGFRVLVNGVFRGLTAPDGRLQVPVRAGAVEVSLQRAPNEGGSALVPMVAAGSTAVVNVPVDDGKEIAADGRLRLDAAQQGVLARNATRIALRFMDAREQAVRLSVLYDVQLIDTVGKMTSLNGLFSVQADGSVAAAPTAFYQALSGKTGRLRLQVSGEDVGGAVHSGSTDFHLADFRVRVQLVAPPSNPTLPLAGVRLMATVLNTELRFQAQSDANGVVVLPDLPRGNLRLSGTTRAGDAVYIGLGAAALNFNSLVRLTLRAPVDVLANVTSITVQQLAAGVGTTSLAAPAPLAAVTPTGAPTADAAESTRAPLRDRSDRPVPVAAMSAPTALTLATAAAPSVSVSAAAGGQDVAVENTASLTVPMGTKKLTLRYVVSTAEYPTFVLAQSVFNDVWSLSVLSGTRGILFEQTRQINSQLGQEPMWQSDGSTGEVKKEIDVAALTVGSEASVIVGASSVNIGDAELTTVVNATLDTSAPLLITGVEATASEITTRNDGTYYSVPRPATVNTYERTFTVDVTKPSGSTLTAVSVELLDSRNDTLMTVLQDAAPGSSAVEVVQQDDTTTRFKVRATVSAPVSTVGGVPPPTRDLGYRVRVKGTDSAGSALMDEKSTSSKRSLWRMPDGRLRYGARDNGGDDWISQGAYDWITANGVFLREIDDVSGEHGRDIGHTTHARGTDIDMYHFYRFPNATSGSDNFNRLTADVVTAFGTLQPPGPGSSAARAAFDRVAAWVTATRAGLASLAALPSVAQLIYCRGTATQGLAAGWCSGLIQAGSVSRTVITAAGAVVQTIIVGGTFANSKLSWQNDHNNHVHITLGPAQIGE